MELQTIANKIKYVSQYLDLCRRLNDLGFDLNDETVKALMPKSFRKFKNVKKELSRGIKNAFWDFLGLLINNH